MTVSGMDRDTGKRIDGVAYLLQRLRDVLTTPKGSLVGARDFGSRLYELNDRNVNRAFQMDAYIRITEAVANPANGLGDFRFGQLRIYRAGDGVLLLDGDGQLLAEGEPITFEGLLL